MEEPTIYWDANELRQLRDAFGKIIDGASGEGRLLPVGRRRLTRFSNSVTEGNIMRDAPRIDDDITL